MKLPENEIGQFYSGDSYVLILYFVHPPDEDEDDESGDSDATDNTATEQDLADDDESASQVDAAPKMNGKSGGLGFASYKHVRFFRAINLVNQVNSCEIDISP